MNILITGGTGFVGKHLIARLINYDHDVYVLSRTPEAHQDTEHVTFLNYQQTNDLPIIHAVVNLAGDSLFGYWTKTKKERIYTSRMETTQALLTIVKQMDVKPTVWLNGSAVGFYGMSEDVIFTEKTRQPGNDFLAAVVKDWEKTASQAEKMGIRTVYARFGVILGDAGALPLMTLPMKGFVGGKIGHGEQWLSWVHIDDAVSLIYFCLQNTHINGPVNVTAPNPKRNKDFSILLAKTLKRPNWFPTPTLVMYAVLGQMGQLITKGQYVLPQKAEAHGFTFDFPKLDYALPHIINQSKH